MPTFAVTVRITLCPNMTLVDCEHTLKRIPHFVYLKKRNCVKRTHSQCACSAIYKIATVVDGRFKTRVTTANGYIDGIDRGEVFSRLSFEIVPLLMRIVNSTLLSFHIDTYSIVHGCYRYSVGRTALTSAVRVNNSCLKEIPTITSAENRDDIEGDHKYTVVQLIN
jgi:hypothetical protein